MFIYFLIALVRNTLHTLYKVDLMDVCLQLWTAIAGRVLPIGIFRGCRDGG